MALDMSGDHDDYLPAKYETRWGRANAPDKKKKAKHEKQKTLKPDDEAKQAERVRLQTLQRKLKAFNQAVGALCRNSDDSRQMGRLISAAREIQTDLNPRENDLLWQFGKQLCQGRVQDAATVERIWNCLWSESKDTLLMAKNAVLAAVVPVLLQGSKPVVVGTLRSLVRLDEKLLLPYGDITPQHMLRIDVIGLAGIAYAVRSDQYIRNAALSVTDIIRHDEDNKATVSLSAGQLMDKYAPRIDVVRYAKKVPTAAVAANNDNDDEDLTELPAAKAKLTRPATRRRAERLRLAAE